MEHGWAYEWVIFDFVLQVDTGFGPVEKAEGSSKKREQHEQNQKPRPARCVWGTVNCLAGQDEDSFKKAGLAHSVKCCKDVEVGEMRKSDFI